MKMKISRNQFNFMDNIRSCEDCGEMFLSLDKHRKLCCSCRAMHHFAARMKYKHNVVNHVTPKAGHNTCNEFYNQAEYIVLDDPNGLFRGSKFSLNAIKDMVEDGYFYTAVVEHEKTRRIYLAGELV